MSTQPKAQGRARLRIAACATAVAVAALAIGATAPAHAEAAVPAPAASATARHLDPSQFKGVNWADPRDNFADDAVIPSGLSAADTPAQAYATATQILDGFKHNVAANTIRLPVNPYSVGSSSAWWPDYQQVIKAATDRGFKVILAYWEGPGAEDDGIVDNYATWWPMWSTITSTYRNNPHVYFEPMNEPHGYTQDAWVSLVTTWLDQYSNVPRNRVIVDGTGYADHVNSLCTTPALDGTYLALHDYGFWGTNTYAGWMADFASRIGTCASRTVVDEFGAPMTTGIDYNASATASDAATNNYVAYMQAATDTIRQLHLGGVYWPGLRIGDTYSLESVQATGNGDTLITNSPTGLSLIEWAWGRGRVQPHPAY